MGDLAFGFVGGAVDFGGEAFEQAVEEGVFVGLLVLEFVGESDVAGEVGQDDAPGEGVFPCSATDADVLRFLGDPDAQNFEGGFISLGCGRDVEGFLWTHARYLDVDRL
jgi:hypothetical protein